MNPVFLSDSVWLHFGTSSATTGAATNADSTPTVVVAEDGTDMGYSPTVTNVATGLYKVEIAATAGNGFEAGRRYSVYAVATVGGIAGRDGIGEFEVLAVDLNTSLDAAITSRMATYTQPAGFLAATFPATVASTTNITAGTITTVSGNVEGNVNGSVGSVVGAVGSVTGSVGSVTGLTAANLDVAVSTRLATAGYTAPDNSTIALIAGYTDSIEGRLPAALVGGRMDASVGAMAAGVVTAAAVATDAFDADALATSAVTEIVDAVWAKALETGFTADRLVRIIAAAVAGKVSGGPGSPVFRNVGDTLDQITGTADANGNRTAASYGA